MKLKKISLALILVMVIALFAFPATLYALPIESPQLTAVCSDNPSETRYWVVTNPNTISIEVWHWAVRNSSVYGVGWLTIPANGSVKIPLPFNHANGEIEALRIGWNDDGAQGVPVDEVYLGNTIDDICPSPSPEPEPKTELESVGRTMPMTCWQVWINEENNFQFIFWYLYADNNWVRIYDMEDNLVFEEDLADPNLIVDLPDGMYTVTTFHEAGKILQEFLIGKP